MSLWLLVILIGVVIAAAAYIEFIKSKMALTATVTGKANVVAAKTGFAKFWAALEGWKSNILAWVAAVAQALAALPHVLGYLDEDLLKQWQALPWASVIDAKAANLVTFGCAVLIPVVHSAGLAKAAATVPVTPPQTPAAGS